MISVVYVSCEQELFAVYMRCILVPCSSFAN